MASSGTARALGICLAAAAVTLSAAWAAVPSPGVGVNGLRAETSAAPFPTTIRHVVTIQFENHDVNQTLQASAFSSLASRYDFAPHYFACSHPSLPNYYCQTSGSTQGVTSDCSPGSCATGAKNIVDLLTGAGETWKAYLESMPSPCYKSDTGSGANQYVAHHNPFVYYTDISASACQSNDLPFGQFWSVVNSSSFPNYVWISPNMYDDCHDQGFSYCGPWLSRMLPTLTAAPWFSTSVIFVTFDESQSTDTGGYNALHGGNVYFVAICGACSTTAEFTARTGHYGYLTTLEWLLGLSVGGLGANDNPSVYPPLKTWFSSAACGSNCGGGGPLSVDVAATPTSGTVPLNVGFVSTVSGGAAPYSYAWNFGDGASSTAVNPGHTYSAAGTYTATLRVTDASSPVLNGSASVAVTANPVGGGNGTTGALTPPVVSASEMAVNLGGTENLTASFTGGRAPFVCQWKVEAPGASGFASLGGAYGCSSPTLLTTPPLTTTGLWWFKLKVTDANGTSVHSLPAIVTVIPSPHSGPPGGPLPRGAMILRDE